MHKWKLKLFGVLIMFFSWFVFFNNWFKRNPLKTELIRVLVAIIIATITSIITTEIKLKNEPPKTTQEQAIIDNQQVESRLFPKVEQENSTLE